MRILDTIINDITKVIGVITITKPYKYYTMIENMSFATYADASKVNRRIYEQGYYDYKSVEKNFYSVLDELGELDKNDHCAYITLRLKNKVKVKRLVNGIESYISISPDWGVCNSVALALRFIISKEYWGKKGRKYSKMPMIRSIEVHNTICKDHLHIIVRFKDLKRIFSQNEIKTFLYDTCYNIDEVSKCKGAVSISMIRYCDDTNDLGNIIEYICKTSRTSCDPLR